MKRRKHKAKFPLRHAWLDANDPANAANSKGYWVPTPEQIEVACEIARLQRFKSDGHDDRSLYRHPRVSNVLQPQHPIEFDNLCDSQYWGTEFEDQS